MFKKRLVGAALSVCALLCSSAAYSQYDDSTGNRPDPIVLNTVRSHNSMSVVINNTFNDIINHQIDRRLNDIVGMLTKQFDDRLKSSLGQLTPVGYIMITLNSTNPSTLGYVGNWALLPDQVSLISSRSGIGSVVGSNVLPVPLPLHSHTGSDTFVLNKRFWTSTAGAHSHTIYFPRGDKYWSKGDGNGYWGSGSGIRRSTEVAGAHNHYVDVNFGRVGGNFTTSAVGVKDAKLDVRGRREQVYMWKRVS